MMTRLTRVQTREQIADVANLAREIWTEHYVSIIGQDQVDYMLAKFQSEGAIAAQLAKGHEYYTVSPGAGEVVGYMAIVPDEATGTALISKLYVKKSWRAHGVGHWMIEHIEALCRERRIGSLWLTVNKSNTHSIAWYMRQGFKNAGSVVQDIGGDFVMDDYRLEKSINYKGKDTRSMSL